MKEIEALPWNGRNVVSTFSGCGGSCLGYRMAGFRVLWANEFIPAAQETYRLNHPTSFLDCRDIRQVAPASILEQIGLAEGELDLLDGSPPCSSFSTAGKRDEGWGEVRKYSDTAQRTDDLFYEYVRILAGLKPRVFVAENVSGLVKGVAKGYFIAILGALREAGYRVSCRVLDAQWLGVPQARQRTIFVGIRNDLGLEPVHPEPLPFRYSIRDALPWIGERRVVHDPRGSFRPAGDVTEEPCPAIMTDTSRHFSVRKAVAVIHDTSGIHSQGDVTDRPCPAITVGVNSLNSRHYQVVEEVEPEAWLEGYATGEEYDKLRQGESSDKYFSLVRADAGKPVPTIQASHGSPGIAGVSHPFERRKFTIAELRRLCGFPDDFQLTGPYTKQWERLGRSVPPVMMYHIAKAIQEGIFARL